MHGVQCAHVGAVFLLNQRCPGVVSLVDALLGAQNIVPLDVNFRTVTNSLTSCVVAVLAVLPVAVAAPFHLIDTDEANIRSVDVSGIEVELADVCANTTLALAISVETLSLSDAR